MRIRYFLQTVLFILFMHTTICAQHASPPIQTGAEQMDKWFPLLKGKRVGMVINHTSVIGKTLLVDSLHNKGLQIVRIFAPEHGFRGQADAGEAVGHSTDRRTGIPIVSLYGKNKKPTSSQLHDLDWVIFDIQDVGARFYTYISTLYYVMEACAENGKHVLVLDRPNPCDYVDGPLLNPRFKSFVGMLPIPLLHGCTVGELACMINGESWLKDGKKCHLKVIPITGWQHGQPYSLPVKPSPNLPNDQSIALYPSLCPFEATPISVGRGTYHPFQVLGVPNLLHQPFQFKPVSLPGFDKHPLHQDKICHGEDLRQVEAPKGFSLHYVFRYYNLLKKEMPQLPFFKRPQWFDLLMGTDQVRKDILNGKTEADIRKTWQPELAKYRKIRAKYLIYPEIGSKRFSHTHQTL